MASIIRPFNRKLFAKLLQDALGEGRALGGGSGISYPTAVLLAGAQRGWNAQFVAPATSPPNQATIWSDTSVHGLQADLPAGWKYLALADVPTVPKLVGAIANTAADATLDGWDTNGRPVLFRGFAAPTVQNCRIRNKRCVFTPGVGIGSMGSAITGPITIQNNDMDGEGDIGGPCRFVGSMSGGILTVTSMLSGEIFPTMTIDTGIAASVAIATFGTSGTTGTGGVGTYAVPADARTLSSRTFNSQPFMQSCISEHAGTYHSQIIISGNRLRGSADDTIQLNSSGALVEDNYLGVGGWNAPLAHWDAIQIQSVLGTGGPILVRGNYGDATPGIPGVSPDVSTIGTSYGRTSSGCLSQGAAEGVWYTENIFGGPGARIADIDGVLNLNAAACNWLTNNRRINNNVFEWGTNAFHPNSRYEVEQFNSNYRLLDASLMTYSQDQSEWERGDDFFWVRGDGFTWLKGSA